MRKLLAAPAVCRIGAVVVAAFTLGATFFALRCRELAPPARFMVANAFSEHLGRAGGFLLVPWHDLLPAASDDFS